MIKQQIRYLVFVDTHRVRKILVGVTLANVDLGHGAGDDLAVFDPDAVLHGDPGDVEVADAFKLESLKTLAEDVHIELLESEFKIG